MANVDKCETDGYTRVVNVDGVKSVVAAAKKVNARVVFFSSSYVFDGSKTDAYTVWDLPMPSQQYGLQKLMGEIAVLNSDKRNVVIRTVAVFGKEDKRKNFAYKIIDTLEQGNLVYVSLDQRVNPIHATKLASNSVNLVEDGFTGLVHIAGSDEVTKYDFALDIASSFQLNTDYVVGVMDKDIPHKATRPWNGCLAGCTENSYQSALETFYEQN
jgi:dTDP-4-dehydrorhamnose reductase